MPVEPLSIPPWLVIFYDLEQRLQNTGVLNRINTVIDVLWDLEYADDTINFWEISPFHTTGIAHPAGRIRIIRLIIEYDERCYFRIYSIYTNISYIYE